MARAKRPKLISFLAGWLMVCSVVGALVFVLVIPSVETIHAEGELAQSIVAHLGRYGLLAVALVVYAFAGSIGFGLWNLRPWGRQALLAASAILVAVSIVVGTGSALREHSFDLTTVINGLVFGWPILYFNRPTIKALFAQPSTTSNAP